MATLANSPAVLKGYLALEAEWDKSGFTAQEPRSCCSPRALRTSAAIALPRTAPSQRPSSRFPPRPSLPFATAGNAKRTRSSHSYVNSSRSVAMPNPRDITRFLAAGYTKPQVMELLLGVALKTISNYLDHISPSPLDAAFASEK